MRAYGTERDWSVKQKRHHGTTLKEEEALMCRIKNRKAAICAQMCFLKIGFAENGILHVKWQMITARHKIAFH